MQNDVHRSRNSGRGYHSQQSAVWSEVEDKLRTSATRSPSSAYADYKRKREVQLRSVRGELRSVSDQVGFVAAIADEIVGVEAIGRTEVFLGYFDRLIDAYAIDALDAEQSRKREEGSAPDRGPDISPELSKRAGEFLGKLRLAPIDTARSLGLGEDLRMASDEVEGSALVADDLVHLTAAPALTPEADVPDENESAGLFGTARRIHRRLRRTG